MVSQARLRQVAKANLKHGAAAAERAITTGAPLTGMAQEMQGRVTDELETQGVEAIIRRDAIRLQTVADLYFAAILGADSLERLDAFVKRYGWLAASALRAWQQVQETERRKGSAMDVTDFLRGGNGQEDNAKV